MIPARPGRIDPRTAGWPRGLRGRRRIERLGDGTVSRARRAPDRATCEFFTCLRDQPAPDFGGARNPDGQGFAAFGTVVRGMDVIRRIHQALALGRRLTPPVAIAGARRVAGPT